MQGLWTGSISFGLVNIPIKLYKGVNDPAMHFTLLHKTDHSPVNYIKKCKAEGKEIKSEDIVKGFKIAKDEYIILEDKDFERLTPRSSHSIDLIEFFSEKEIDFRYFEKPYYLEPTKGADKAYALLREALKESKKVGLSKCILHNREHLAILKALDTVLVLEIIRFSTEIRDISKLNLPTSSGIKRAEMEMALHLIQQQSRKFKPDEFYETYSEEIKHIITTKMKGKKIISKKVTQEKIGKVTDLMSVLKASLQKEKIDSTKKSKNKQAGKTKQNKVSKPRRKNISKRRHAA